MHSFVRNWQLHVLNQRKGEHDKPDQSPQKNVADLAGVEPASSWSQVRRTSVQNKKNIRTLLKKFCFCSLYVWQCSIFDWLIVLGFNDTSTLEGHFVSSPREREKRDRRESRGDEREGQGRKRNRNESEETEEIKTFPLYPYPLQG